MKTATSVFTGVVFVLALASHGLASQRAPETPYRCFAIGQAPTHVGQNGCIVGRVIQVYTSRSNNTFLNFCRDYRTCPSSGVVFASDRNQCGDLERLEGREVRIRGLIKTYQGRTEIIIRKKWQIRSAL